MSGQEHLIVEKGPDAGLKIAVPACGCRIGRSSKNDIVLKDPHLSRHHCRIYFKTGDGMWVADLGSSNETLLNYNPIQDAKLKPGDRISIGDTVIMVVDDKFLDAPAVHESAPSISLTDAKPINLGLSETEEEQAPAGKRLGRGKLIMLAGIAAVLCAIIWVPRFMTKPAKVKASFYREQETSGPISIEYEKTQASSANIFRYAVSIDSDSQITVEIDDLKNDTHVQKQSKTDPELIKGVAQAIKDSGFHSLNDKYQGIKPDDVEQFDLTVTIGKLTHRCVVLNQTEPEQFKKSRETLEAFVMNEMGLWAIQYSADKLKQMAEESYVIGRKFYEEREIAFSNLSQAIKKLNEAQWYLETVQPKPDYYDAMIKGINDAANDLQAKYDDRIFRSKKAAELRDWEEAARELRIILDLVPDRTDQRHKDARKDLSDIERRINTKNKP